MSKVKPPAPKVPNGHIVNGPPNNASKGHKDTKAAASKKQENKGQGRDFAQQMLKDGQKAAGDVKNKIVENAKEMTKGAAGEFVKNAASDTLGPMIELTIGNFCHLYNMATGFMPGVRKMVNNSLADFLSKKEMNPETGEVSYSVRVTPEQIEQVLKHPGEAIEILGPNIAKQLSDKLKVIDNAKLKEARQKGMISFVTEFSNQILGVFGGEEARKAGLLKGSFLAAKSAITKPALYVWDAFKAAKGVKKLFVGVAGFFGLSMLYKFGLGVAKLVFKILWKPVEWAMGLGATVFGIKKVGSMLGKGKGAPAPAPSKPSGNSGDEPLHQKALTGAHSILKNSLGQLPGGGAIADGVMNKVKDIVPGNNKKLGGGGAGPLGGGAGGAMGGMGNMLGALAGAGGGGAGGGMGAMGNLLGMLGGKK